MFFFRNKHMMIDLGTGNNNKINWPISNKQEMIDIIETIYRGAKRTVGWSSRPKTTPRSTSTERWLAVLAKGCNDLQHVAREAVAGCNQPRAHARTHRTSPTRRSWGAVPAAACMGSEPGVS